MKRYFSFVLFILLICFSFFTGNLLAADAIPDPFVPCDEEEFENPEFNSQRPYQASPCGDAPKAYYCSNDYIIEEKISVPWGNNCSLDSFICTGISKIFKKNYEIFLSEVKFPILGNTQQVANSENGLTEEFDDAQKMNEYLSWYLSGANQKAEYGLDTQSETVNFSGPLKKLTPSVIQELQRFKVLHDAGVKDKYISESEKDKDPNNEGVEVDETFSHNQIAVCTTPNLLTGPINWLREQFGLNPIESSLWIGPQKPVPCYSGNGAKANNQKRLVTWWEGKQSGLIESFKVIQGWDGSKRWNYLTPPFPWQFTDNIYYEKAYNEWRGKECILDTTPILGAINKLLGKRLLCTDLRWKNVVDFDANIYADLYQYIPLGVTSDKASGHVVTGLNIEGLGGTIAERPTDANGNSLPGTYFVEQNPVLYYPHTQSTYEMTKLLNDTQSPQGGVTGVKIGGQAPENPKDYEFGQCEIVDVRSNEGDDLTFDQNIIRQKQRVYVRDVQFKVTQVGCTNQEEITEYFETCPNPLNIKCLGKPSCDGIVQIVIPTTPKIPWADQIWAQTTVGQTSAFRRIFPKVEEGAPVSCIADIPGVSEVTYTPSSGTNLVNVNTPAGKKSPEEAQLFFPHLGTIYEYFLKGIQTALRPQGFGEPITNGTLCVTGEGDCTFDVNKAYAAIQEMAGKYNIPAELLKTIFEFESGPYIADPGSYKCEENSAGAAGIAQIKKATYNIVTCENERLDNDIGICIDSRGGKLSRCSIRDSIELMARILLFGAGKWVYGPGNCQATGGLTLANKAEWYNAACNYGTGTNPNTITINYQNSIPVSERPVGRDMNYCDVICHKMGQCPSYP